MAEKSKRSRLVLGLYKDIPCFIGEDIVVTYFENRGSQQVGIRIDAPRELKIHRGDCINMQPKAPSVHNSKRYIAGRKNEET